MNTSPLSGICIRKYLPRPLACFSTPLVVPLISRFFSSLSQVSSIFLLGLSNLTTSAWGWGAIDKSERFVLGVVDKEKRLREELG